MLPIGYEFKKPSTRRIKTDLDRALYFNLYKNTQMKKIRKPEGIKVGVSKEKSKR